MRKIFTFLLKGVAFILFLLLFYLIIAVVGSLIPVNTDRSTADQYYEIFIESNGVHTDIGFPLQSPLRDWTRFIDPDHTISGDQNYKYIAFGWGDLEFYKNTPEWSDLTPKIAFKSLFLETPSAMHVKYSNRAEQNDRTIFITLNADQYTRLSDYVIKSFDLDPQGKPKKVPDLHYSSNDAFYKAVGSLNLFYTCNTWTNDALKSSGMKACLWTPFVEGIFYRYQ